MTGYAARMAAPLDDIRALIAGLPGFEEPPPAAGRLAELAAWFAAGRGEAAQVRRPILSLYAGAPVAGRLAESEGKRARLEAIAAGEAPVSRMAAAMGAGLEAFDLAIDRPIGDVEAGAALGERECAATMAFGMEVLAKQPDLLMIGHVGAFAAGEGVFGPGDPLDRLRGFAGREASAAAGAIIAARNQKVPVILDGEAAGVAAFLLEAARPGLSRHCLLARPLGVRLQQALGMAPLIDLGVEQDGEAALAAAVLVRLAVSRF